MSTVLPFRPAATPPTPHTVELILKPVAGRPGRYSASRADTGELILRSSRQPTLDAARALAAQGLPDDTTLRTRHANSSIIAMSGQLGQLGQLRRWTIHEGDRSGLRRVEWQSFSGTAASANGPAGPSQAPQDRRQAIADLSVVREARRAPGRLRSTATTPSRRIAA